MKIRLLTLVIVGTSVLAACGGGADEPEATDATPTVEEVPAPDSAAAPTPDLYAGWNTYTNADYGFSFRYPQTWTVQESPNAVTLTQDTKSINIGYRNASESVQITGTGTAAGDFQTGSPVSFLGASFTTNLLVSQDRVNTVYYGSPNDEITAGDLVFSIALVDNATDPAAIDLSQTIQSEAAQILGSFTTTSGATASPQQAPAQPAQEAETETEGLQPAEPQAPAPLPAGECEDNSDFVTDVTVPDGTEFTPGEAFVKTWRLINNGTCAWTTGYQFYYVSGAQMSAQSSVGIPRTVNPGEQLDVSVQMVAPDDSGEHTAYWNLANTGGRAFGPLFFVTVVVEEEATPTEEADPDAETTPTATESSENGDSCVDDSDFVTDVTIPDGSQFTPGASFTKTWRIMNSGTCTWDTTYNINFESGTNMAGVDTIAFASSIAPGQTFDISIDMTAPATAGNYTSQWNVTNGDDVVFGTHPFVEIIVSN